MKPLLFALLLTLTQQSLPAAGVRVDATPFPSDLFTQLDTRQRTGLRVNLPLPDCSARPADCVETRIVNQLDGFHPNPRITIRFTAPIDPDTLREGARIAWLDSKTPDRFQIYPAGKLSPVNQVGYDPATNTAVLRPDEVLQSSRRYLIVLTDAVRDLSGDPVEMSLCTDAGEYCVALRDAVTRIQSSLGGRRIIAASLFTTLSATAFLEEARRLIQESPVPAVRSGPTPFVPLANLRAVTILQQVRTSPGNQIDELTFSLPPDVLSLANLGRAYFGSFRSPRYLDATLTIPEVPTGEPLTPTSASDEIHFHVFLPNAPPPPGGYPVLIAAHGLGDSRFGMPTAMALANGAGRAVIAINTFGHGYGPNSALRLTFAGDRNIEVSAPGRGVDIDGNQRIDPFEGCIVVSPDRPIGARDCIRQTAIDYLQLVRILRSGLDLDGDGRVDLNREGIQLAGQSFGSWVGTLVMALEPSIETAVLNVAPANAVDTARLSPSLRVLTTLFLGLRQPSLLNRGFEYEEEIPLRNEPVRLIRAPGALAIQEALARFEWIETSGSALVFAPHLKSATLPGVGAKRILWQMAWGDRTVPNPSTAALIRAANMTDSFTVYRHDVARQTSPDLDPNPHAFLVPLGNADAQLISLLTLQQVLGYLVTSGAEIVDPNPLARIRFPRDIFERPANPPDRLNLGN